MRGLSKRITNISRVLLLLAPLLSCEPTAKSTDDAAGEETGYLLTQVPVKNTAYGIAVSDSAETILSEKYASQTSASWGCHDPKLFQDDDGSYYVYSTGWTDGVQVRSSSDLIAWKRFLRGAFYSTSFVSVTYGHKLWDDDFLKWVGYKKNNGVGYTASYGGNSYTSSSSPNSWAPTVCKQNGKYYMFHGIITDSMVSSKTDGIEPFYVNPAACISMSIAEDPRGPFIPASLYDSSTYSQSSLVRYVWTKDSSAVKSDSAIGYTGCYNQAGGSWSQGFGCIDPEFVYDIATGQLVTYTVGENACYGILYGSWKGGLALVFVDAETFKPVCTAAGTSTFDGRAYSVGDEMDAPLDSVSGNQGKKIAGGRGTAYEGAQLVYNSDTSRYYLFVSMGDLTSQYRVGVGRSQVVTDFTPAALPVAYYDASGRDMNAVVDTTGSSLYYHNVGSKIIGAQCLSGEYGITSPGGLSICRASDGKILFANHARTTYAGSGNFLLQVHQLFFTDDGWPLLNQNDYYDEAAELPALSLSDIAGSYQVILTRRSTDTVADGSATESQTMTISEDGSISGDYSGSVTLSGTSATITLSGTGTFRGSFLHAVDWNRKSGSLSERRTITFTALCSDTAAAATGEYLWGNKS